MSNDFRIYVTTADKEGAGTNSRVYITLEDAAGTKSKEFQLDSPDNDFERGQTNYFTLTTEQDLGVIARIKLRSDFSKKNAPWTPDTVWVQKVSSRAFWIFTARKTLDKTKPERWFDSVLLNP